MTGCAPSFVKGWEEVHLGYTRGGRRCAIISQGVDGSVPSIVRVWREVRHQ